MKAPQRLEFTASDMSVLVMDFFPAPTEKAPVVVTFTPYLRSGDHANAMPVEALNAAGLHCIVCEIRGTGESQPPFLGPLSPREVQDGAELIEWLADQPFCTGKIGTTGISYPGGIQMLIAARRPRGLACIAPTVGPIDFYRDWTHRGGVPTHTNWGALTFLSRSQPKASIAQALHFYYNACQGLDEDGPFFYPRSAVYQLDQIEVPALVMGGLFDYFGRGSYRAYQGIQTPKRLVFGAWGHQAPDDPSELVTWFSYWLKGEGEDPTGEGSVNFWRIGDGPAEEGGRWISSATLDEGTRLRIPFTETEVALPVYGSDGQWPMPDLADPVPVMMDTMTWSGMHLWGECVTFTVPLESETAVQGLPTLELSLSSGECTDLDLYARLSLVGPNPTQLTEGRLRLSHRTIDEEKTRRDAAGEVLELRLTHKDPVPLSLENVNRVSIEILPTSFVVPEGHELRLGLSAVRTDGSQAETQITIGSDSALVVPVVAV